MSDAIVRELRSSDGRDRLSIYEIEGGLFYYIDEFLHVHAGDEDEGPDPEPFALSACAARSGFYASAADAERDARAAVIWLRDAN